MVDIFLGTPIALRRVGLYRYLKDEPEFEVETDSEGRFRFEGVLRSDYQGSHHLRLDNRELLFVSRMGQDATVTVSRLKAGFLDMGTLLADSGDPVSVEGSILDQYTREPVAFRKLGLRDDDKTRNVSPDLETMTNGEGRFHIAKVPRGREFWPKLDDGEPVSSETRPGVHWFDTRRPAKAVLDWETLVADSGDSLRFAAACRGGSGVPALTHADLLAFALENGQWKHERRMPVDWKPPWKAVLCLESVLKAVGHYGLGAVAPARRHTLKATVVRLSDGKRFRTKVTADPPEKGRRMTGETGDPYPDLEAWLKSLSN